MVEVYCGNCGNKFEAKTKSARFCPDCKEKQKIERKEYAKEYAKKRSVELGLVTMQAYKEERDKLKKLSKENNCSVADMLRKCLTSLNDK